MAVQKLLLILGCVVAVALAESTNSTDTSPVAKVISKLKTAKHSYNPPGGNFIQYYQWGERQRNDRLVYKGVFTSQVNPYQDQQFPWNIQIEEYSPQTRTTYFPRITQVAVFNKIPNESRTTVELRNGGPGWSSVSFLFNSPKGTRVDYQIDVYGF